MRMGREGTAAGYHHPNYVEETSMGGLEREWSEKEGRQYGICGFGVRTLRMVLLQYYFS